jgi:ABC-type multidrug transport system ATPase subunit
MTFSVEAGEIVGFIGPNGAAITAKPINDLF